MGSYDTGEVISRPSRSTRDTSESPSSRSSSDSRSRSTPASSGYHAPAPNDSARVERDASVDYERATLVAVGGGLTPARIVKKIDRAYLQKPMIETVEYLISDEVATTKEEKNIVDAIKERMRRTDYRAIINDFYNFHNERLKTDTLENYLITKEREAEGGTYKYNYADIAIVTHEEGGLEKKCKE
ncbi:hypothetical protein JW756_00065 [Candidatus Woesearchaeota archaeon]|nr:hypothetical protein [Candidatus Woesearchaeota archaeon]